MKEGLEVISEGSGLRGRPRFGLMDGVNIALDSSGVLHDNSQRMGRTGEPWCICR